MSCGQFADHSQDQQAVDTLLNLAQEYTGHTKALTKSTAGAAKDVHADDSLNAAEADLKVCSQDNPHDVSHIDSCLDPH